MKKYSREFTSELFNEYWWLILISALFIYRILSLIIVDIPVFYDEAYQCCYCYISDKADDTQMKCYIASSEIRIVKGLLCKHRVPPA